MNPLCGFIIAFIAEAYVYIESLMVSIYFINGIVLYLYMHKNLFRTMIREPIKSKRNINPSWKQIIFTYRNLKTFTCDCHCSVTIIICIFPCTSEYLCKLIANYPSIRKYSYAAFLHLSNVPMYIVAVILMLTLEQCFSNLFGLLPLFS